MALEKATCPAPGVTPSSTIDLLEYRSSYPVAAPDERVAPSSAVALQQRVTESFETSVTARSVMLPGLVVSLDTSVWAGQLLHVEISDLLPNSSELFKAK